MRGLRNPEVVVTIEQLARLLHAGWYGPGIRITVQPVMEMDGVRMEPHPGGVVEWSCLPHDEPATASDLREHLVEMHPALSPGVVEAVLAGLEVLAGDCVDRAT